MCTICWSIGKSSEWMCCRLCKEAAGLGVVTWSETKTYRPPLNDEKWAQLMNTSRLWEGAHYRSNTKQKRFINQTLGWGERGEGEEEEGCTVARSCARREFVAAVHGGESRCCRSRGRELSSSSCASEWMFSSQRWSCCIRTHVFAWIGSGPRKYTPLPNAFFSRVVWAHSIYGSTP
jgi:hypothetical protein